ncbi:MAG: FlgD immunoglobulin-like domain containing protein, partial [Candidatus Eisenbacteria bacterium]
LLDATAGDVGTTKTIDLFLDDFSVGLFGFGCVFCVTDKTKIENDSWVYVPRTDWGMVPYFWSDGPTFPWTLPDYITDRYPNHRCYLLQGTNLQFNNQISTFPSSLGTLTYDVAEEGCIQWVFDVGSAVLTSISFSSLAFSDPGETCDTVSCPAAGEPLAINPDVPACPLPDATLNVAYQTGVIFTATGGTPPYEWGQSGLPENMNINTTTGEIYGTPTAFGAFPFIVTVDGGGHAERACSLFVLKYGVDVVLLSADTTTTGDLDSVFHDFRVQNTGNVETTFGLSAWSTAGYSVSIVGPTTTTLAPGATSTHQMKHYIPDVPCPDLPATYVWDTAYFKAEYPVPTALQRVALAEDTDSAVVRIAPDAGVLVTHLGGPPCGLPGTTYMTSFSVENTGECADTFDLETDVSLPSWNATLPGGPTIVLNPGATNNVTVYVSIPAGALCTEVADVWLRADGRVFGAVDADTTAVCVEPVLAGTLSQPNGQVGAPGDTVTYCFNITNTGNCAGLFQLDYTFGGAEGWLLITTDNDTVLGVGQTGTICVGHVVPDDAVDGQTDELCAALSAPDQPGPDLDESCVTTTVGVPCNSTVDVVHTGNPDCGDPGTTVRDTFSVENTGDCEETFDFSASADLNTGWTANIVGDDFATLVVGQMIDVYVDVTIPAGALCTDVAELTFDAEGQNYGATDSDVGSICVNPVFNGTLSDESDQNGAPGDTVDYQFTVTNTGNCTAEYLIGFSAMLWNTTHEATEEMLDPGDTAIVDVGHIVPKNAEEGDKDKLCAALDLVVNAVVSKQGHLDESCVLTTAIVPCDAGVDVTGDTFLSGLPGDTTVPDFFVENTGNDPDQYALTATCAEGWFVEIVGSETTPVLNPGDIHNVEVLVVIPEGEPCGSTASVELAAYSSCAPSVWDAHTVEIMVDPVCSVSVAALTEDSTGTAGQTMAYFFRVRNEGNCDSDFKISVSQFPADWDSSLGETWWTLQAGEFYDFPAEVVIPADAETGDEHKFVVCAECKTNPDGPRPEPDVVCDSTITRVLTGCVADQPILSLGGYQTISYVPYGLWTVQVGVRNNGPGKARSIAAEMNHDLSWLLIPDPTCDYPDLAAGQSSFGLDDYTFDLQNYPGGSFNVWFDVTYTDTCGMQYKLQLDPTFLEPMENELPGPTQAQFVLHQNIPNPFNPQTTISFELPSGAFTELVIYNTAGQVVKSLWVGSLPAGLHSFLWDGESDHGTSVPSGTYFYSLRSGGLADTKRMVLIR